MVATLYLIGCVLAPAQPADRLAMPARTGESFFGPRFAKSEEFVYRGTYDEENVGDRVRFCRSYRLDTRIFVLDTPPNGADIAVLTVLKPRDNNATPPRPGVSGEPAVNSARIELVKVDLQGRINAEAEASTMAPLDGPPTVELGAFVISPSGRAASDGVWTVAEPGRPPRTWHRAGNEMVNGNSCVKLIGEQQSEDWDKPRADRGAWRRTDTVWVAPRLGVAFRVERLIERRDPAFREPTHKLQLRYELDSSVQYPGQLSEDRRQEITRARAFSEAATPLLAEPTRYNAQLTALLARVNLHLEHQAPTPYRDAIVYLRKQVEAAKRGETPAAASGETLDKPTVATIGLPAPDFIAPDLLAGSAASARLRDWLGQPVVLVFYNPASATAEDVLPFARGLHNRFHGGLAVVGLAVTDDAAAARRQRAELDLRFPILSGNGLRISYSVETTPKIVVIDASGVVRGTYLGWGGETPGEVMGELRKWLRHP